MTFPSPTPIREAFGQALLELGAADPRAVVLTADLSDAIRVQRFAEAYPERFFQMGVSESDMMGTAAGLALNGFVPFATTFAVFATSQANQAVRLSIGYNRANVKIATSHGGVCVGGDGATHQSFEDIALMRVIPGMAVVVPCDANQAYAATFAVARYEGPVYFRLGRIPSPVMTTGEEPFEIGRAQLIRSGSDVCIVASGSVLQLAISAAEELGRDGIECRVLNMHTIKPIDREAVAAAARECGAIVTVEEHSIIGGLGSAVADVVVAEHPVSVRMIGVKDTFGESAEPPQMMEILGLTHAAVTAASRACVESKSRRSTARA